MAIADHFNRASEGLAEQLIVAAAERTGSVLTVIRAVLHRKILLSVQHGMPCVIFCRKTGHYERTCRGRRVVGMGRVGLIHKDGTKGELTQNDPEANYESSVGWVTDSNAVAHGWDSDSSADYVIMSVRRKQEEELKVSGAKLALKINDYSTQAWIDSGSPVSIFTLGELKRTLGARTVQLHQLDPKYD